MFYVEVVDSEKAASNKKEKIVRKPDNFNIGDAAGTPKFTD